MASPGSVGALRTHADASGAIDAFSGPPVHYSMGEGIGAGGKVELQSQHPIHWSVPMTVSKAWGTMSIDAQAVPAIADDSVSYHWTKVDGKATAGRPFNGMLYVDAEELAETAEWYIATAEYGSCWRAVSALHLSSVVPKIHGTVTVSECTSVHAGLPVDISGDWTGVTTAPMFSYLEPSDGSGDFESEDLWLGKSVERRAGSWDVSPAAVLPLPEESCISGVPESCTQATCGDWSPEGWCGETDSTEQVCGRFLTVQSTGRDEHNAPVTAHIPVKVLPPTLGQAGEIAASAQVRVNQGPSAFSEGDVVACSVVQALYPDQAGGGCLAATSSLLSMLAAQPAAKDGPVAAHRVRRLGDVLGLVGAIINKGGDEADKICCQACRDVESVVDSVLATGTGHCGSGKFEVKNAGSSEVNGCYSTTATNSGSFGQVRYEQEGGEHYLHKNWAGVWEIMKQGRPALYYKQTQTTVPDGDFEVYQGGVAPGPSVAEGHPMWAPLSSATQDRANAAMAYVLGTCTCSASCTGVRTSSGPQGRKAATQQTSIQTKLDSQSAFGYLDRMHTVLANGVRRREPGSKGSINTFGSPGDKVQGMAVADMHGTFRGGRSVGSSGVQVRFSGEKLPFGSKEAGQVFTVSVVVAGTEIVELEIPNSDHLGLSVYTVKVWSSDSLARDLSSVEVEIKVDTTAGDAPSDSPLRTLRQGVWGLPEGCTDVPPHAVRCPAKHVPGTWALRLHSPRVPTPAPAPLVASPSPPTIGASPSPPTAPVHATPYPPGSIPFLTPRPDGSATPSPPNLGVPKAGDTKPEELMIILAIACAVLLALLSGLCVVHWRRRTLASLEGGKRPGAGHKIVAPTGEGYGDLTETGSVSGTGGSGEGATEPTTRDP